MWFINKEEKKKETQMSIHYKELESTIKLVQQIVSWKARLIAIKEACQKELSIKGSHLEVQKTLHRNARTEEDKKKRLMAVSMLQKDIKFLKQVIHNLIDGDR